MYKVHWVIHFKTVCNFSWQHTAGFTERKSKPLSFSSYDPGQTANFGTATVINFWLLDTFLFLFYSFVIAKKPRLSPLPGKFSTQNQLPCKWMDSQPLTYNLLHSKNLLSVLWFFKIKHNHEQLYKIYSTYWNILNTIL